MASDLALESEGSAAVTALSAETLLAMCEQQRDAALARAEAAEARHKHCDAAFESLRQSLTVMQPEYERCKAERNAALARTEAAEKDYSNLLEFSVKEIGEAKAETRAALAERNAALARAEAAWDEWQRASVRADDLQEERDRLRTEQEALKAVVDALADAGKREKAK